MRTCEGHLISRSFVPVSIFVSSVIVNSTTKSGKFVLWRSLSGSRCLKGHFEIKLPDFTKRRPFSLQAAFWHAAVGGEFWSQTFQMICDDVAVAVAGRGCMMSLPVCSYALSRGCVMPLPVRSHVPSRGGSLSGGQSLSGEGGLYPEGRPPPVDR